MILAHLYNRTWPARLRLVEDEGVTAKRPPYDNFVLDIFLGSDRIPPPGWPCCA